jgi:anti-anti-sigma factor
MIAVHRVRSRDVVILYLEGDLRAPLNDVLRMNVDLAIRHLARRILISLAGVTELDAAGLGELVHAHTVATAAGVSLRIADGPVRVRELIRRAGLLDLLSVESERLWLEAV